MPRNATQNVCTDLRETALSIEFTGYRFIVGMYKYIAIINVGLINVLFYSHYGSLVPRYVAFIPSVNHTVSNIGFS